MTDASLERLIERLNAGDVEAVERVLIAYEPYLRIVVRRRLGRRLRTKVDSMDIVQSVFANVLGGFRGAGWRFAGRSQLLAFLRRIAWRRLANRCAEGGKAVFREQPLVETAEQSLPRSALPRPSEVAQGRELWDQVLDVCPPAHREVVRLRARGFRVREIAARTNLHEGSVRRIFYEIARSLAAKGKPVDGRVGLAE